jgi:hypothetical protein
LPDGLFSNQKSQFGKIFEGLSLENLAIFYGQYDFLRKFGIFLRPFGTILYSFGTFIWFYQEKSGSRVY